MNKLVEEMVQEYRHLSFLQQELAGKGAYHDANCINRQLDEIINVLKTTGYSVGSLIEEVKDTSKKLFKYEHIVVFSDGGVRNHHDSEQESKAASAFLLYGNKERLKQQGEYIGQTYTLPSGSKVEVNSTLAEYAGILQGMDFILNNHLIAKKYTFVTDCSVMAEQILNKRNPINVAFQECVQSCQKKMNLLGNVEIKHVPRELNKWADALVNDVLNEHERVGALC